MVLIVTLCLLKRGDGFGEVVAVRQTETLIEKLLREL